jgi:hypothetical protein
VIITSTPGEPRHGDKLLLPELGDVSSKRRVLPGKDGAAFLFVVAILLCPCPHVGGDSAARIGILFNAKCFMPVSCALLPKSKMSKVKMSKCK